MQVSFGKRIPISTCNVLNLRTKQFESATIYEIDCKDTEDDCKRGVDDITYLRNIAKRNWEYSYDIMLNAVAKKAAQQNTYLATYWGTIHHKDNKFYSIENKNGEVLGLCETTFPEGCINIEYLESSPGRGYEYTGQNMVANVSRAALNSGKTAIVRNPAITARKFYTKICKFKEAKDSWTLVQPRENAEEFLREVEQKTHINYNA